MMDHNADIEKNIHEMKNFFNKLDSIIDSLPYAVSEPVKKLIKEQILKISRLKNLWRIWKTTDRQGSCWWEERVREKAA